MFNLTLESNRQDIILVLMICLICLEEKQDQKTFVIFSVKNKLFLFLLQQIYNQIKYDNKSLQ